ncbi:flagellar filament capping protein FliD [Clostridium estertheticum]|uniref:flagellar filament capping protein FliD n=1 Tax=Clostridium estertheticum TaxID=238834 RepID=UPI001C7D2222|nr:flagellar filament capping protein FliD [Clostridium estertheticum]MBX4262482.1 flagellar filament capping protein FliD [Clostridium estertheticum]WLC68911.1 flagellar filament capping protein FliD [Clostridium estertheticum]
MTSIYPSTTGTSSTTSSANKLRVSGMASGIDTDAVVKSMVSNYQAKIDKANQAKQTLQWQQEGYRDIIKGIKGLQDYFDPLSSKYMMSGSSLNINTAASDDAAVVSATSGSTAKAGTYKVNVSQLAEQSKISGSTLNSMIKVTDTTKWNNATLTLGTTPITLDTISDNNGNGTSLDEVVANINSKISADPTLKGTVSASYVNNSTGSYIKFTSTSSMNVTAKTSGGVDLGPIPSANNGISSSTKLSELNIADGMSFSLSYNSATTTTPIVITANSTDTIQNLIDKVNSATGGAVTMSVDSTTGTVSLNGKDYGSTANLKITNPSADAIKLGLTAASSSGKDAIVAITNPGQTTATTTTQSSNKFTVNGVAYNLTGVNAGTETSNVTVTSNSDTVVSNVKKFIEDYNTIISTINTKLTEKKDKSYAPLTDAQRTSMSDTQITTWEAKAKVGILRKDDNLSSLLTQLRGTLYSPVYSTSDSADASTGKVALNFGSYGSGAVGIATSADTTDGGKLVIKAGDEAKLKSVIENNMEDFKKLFIGSSSSTLSANEAYAGSKKYKEDGIFTRMDNILRDYVASPGIGKDGAYTLSGSMNIFVNKQYDFSLSGTSGKNTLPDQVYSKTQNASKYQTQLEDAQTRYYAKFTALEKAMNKLNSQQSSLSSMLGTSSS